MTAATLFSKHGQPPSRNPRDRGLPLPCGKHDKPRTLRRAPHDGRNPLFEARPTAKQESPRPRLAAALREARQAPDAPTCSPMTAATLFSKHGQPPSRNPRDRGLPLPCGGATSPGRSDVPPMTAAAPSSKHDQPPSRTPRDGGLSFPTVRAPTSRRRYGFAPIEERKVKSRAGRWPEKGGTHPSA